MHWNHRVLRTSDKVFGMSYAIHECFYQKYDDTIPHAWTDEPVPVHGETLEELRTTLNWMLSALEKPVLVDIDGRAMEVEDGLPAEVTS